MTCYLDRRWLLGLASFLLSAPAIADSTFKLDLTHGPLLSCLEQLAQAAHVRIVDTSDRASSAICTSLHGQFSLEQALDRLLTSVSLGWRRRADGTIEIITLAKTQLELSALAIDGEPVVEPERPSGPAPTVLAEHATAITRIDKHWLDTAPLLGFNQLGRYAPNVYGTGQSLSIRGIEHDYDPFASFSVSLDGIDLGTRLLSDELVPLEDIDHLDLIRGPRAFEAGSESQAGAIRLVTAPPAIEPTLQTTLGIGNEGAWRSGLKWSGPVGTPAIGATLALNRRVLPDFANPDATSADSRARQSDGARLKLNIAPETIPEFSAELAALIISGDSSEHWAHNKPNLSDPSVTFNPFDPNNPDYRIDAHTQARGVAGHARYEDTGWSLTMYASNTAIQREAAEPTTKTLDFENRRQLDISARKLFGQDWTLAASVNQEALDSRPYTLYPELAPAANVELREFSTKTQSGAVWLEHAWGTTLNAGIGLRWVHERAINTFYTGFCDANASKPCTDLGYLLKSVVQQQLPIPLAVINWHPWPNQSFSLSYGHGYRSAGSFGVEKYGSQREKNAELAWQANWFNNHLNTILTVFDGTMHTSYAPTFPVNITSRSKLRGGEFELEADISQHWRLRAGLGLLKTHNLSYGTGIAGFRSQPAAAPRQTAVLGLRFAANANWYGALDAYHAAATETGIVDDIKLLHPAYSLLDLRIGYRTLNWNTALILSNTLNEKYLDRTETLPSLEQSYHLGDLRRIEWQASWNW